MPAPRLPGLAPMSDAAAVVFDVFRARAICTAAELGVADLLAEGPRSIESLAEAAEARPHELGRLMRFLASQGFFEEDDEGRFALNDAAVPLRSDADQSARFQAMYYGSRAIWEAWGGLTDAVRKGTTGFEAVHEQGFWEHLAEDSGDAATFDRHMSLMVRRRNVAGGYDYSGIGTLVDVGGGLGTTLAEVLRANPTMQGMLFDLPDVIARARGTIGASDVADRCELVEGSFFDAVPSGGDAYLLSNILHDWDDEDCRRILRACRAAMEPGAKLLLGESLLPPEPNTPSMAWFVDLQMMVVTGGMQRSQRQFDELFAETGFTPTQTFPAGATSVLEAVAS
jgi:hypothetical protein